MPVDVRKLVANTGLSFFTSLGGLFAGAGIGQFRIPTEAIVIVSLIAAGIQAAIAFFTYLLQDP